MEISLASGAPSELAAKQALEHFFKRPKFDSYFYSKKVCVGAGATSKAFPVITLNSDDAGNENLLLSNFLHHQFRWFVSLQGEKTDDLIDALKGIFPVVPVEGFEMTANTIYLQLAVCSLEYFALLRLTNEEIAKKIVLSKTDYPWVYEQIVAHASEIRKVFKACKISI